MEFQSNGQQKSLNEHRQHMNLCKLKQSLSQISKSSSPTSPASYTLPYLHSLSPEYRARTVNRTASLYA